MPTTIKTGLNGAMAGALATIPMSAVMVGAQRVGLMGRQPPEVITQRALDAANTEPTTTATKALAAALHFAFGAAAGTVFALLNRDETSRPLAVAKGVGFGLALYAASYGGWIPATGILPAPQRDRKGRQPSMAAAHVVYGAALALLLSGDD